MTTPQRAIQSTFKVERNYPHAVTRVFAALTQKDLVRRWRVEDEGCEVREFDYDFRVDGRELSRFQYAGGPEIRLDAQFLDIQRDARIVYSYRMSVGETVLSVSLATIELQATAPTSTHLLHSEFGIYFDSPDSAAGREQGCRLLLEKLAAFLDAQIRS